ncbi:hypothetical protein WN51_10904 [Melipona quadrifasciata]|uniref:Uncharacterized protein n=1 Tax=Melipona quadrifasciata TaxID=166423 RepID=A0A0N0BIB1_9HYME|nr:hypothetical protein WN51_10904 [Melipona quadrifasciata]
MKMCRETLEPGLEHPVKVGDEQHFVDAIINFHRPVNRIANMSSRKAHTSNPYVPAILCPGDENMTKVPRGNPENWASSGATLMQRKLAIDLGHVIREKAWGRPRVGVALSDYPTVTDIYTVNIT